MQWYQEVTDRAEAENPSHERPTDHSRPESLNETLARKIAQKPARSTLLGSFLAWLSRIYHKIYHTPRFRLQSAPNTRLMTVRPGPRAPQSVSGR